MLIFADATKQLDDELVVFHCLAGVPHPIRDSLEADAEGGDGVILADAIRLGLEVELLRALVVEEESLDGRPEFEGGGLPALLGKTLVVALEICIAVALGPALSLRRYS